MAKGTIDFTQSATSGAYIDGKIEWESILNASAGTSNVTVKLYVRKGNTTMTLTVPTQGAWVGSLTVNGTTWNLSSSSAVLESWVLIASKTVSNISHGADGKKSIDISASITAPTGSSLAGHKITGGKTVNLDTIPYATTIDSLTCSSNYLNGTLTAYYTPKNSEYYNRRILYVNVGGTVTHLYTNDMGQRSAKQLKWEDKIPAVTLSRIYALSKNTVSVKIRMTFKTFSDSGYKNQVGQEQYLEIPLLIPTTVEPTVNLEIAPINSNSWIKDKNIYVAGLSGAKVTVSGDPGDGATVSQGWFTYNNIPYTVHTTIPFSANIPTLTEVGTAKFIAKVTDSRGRTAASTPNNITVLQYSAPAVSSMQIERGTYSNGWTAADSGPDVRLTFKATLALSDKGNTYKATFKIDGSAKSPDDGADSGLKSGDDCVVYFLGLDGEASHALTLTATDSVGKSGAATLTIPTIHITMEFNDSGKGIAFGKTSEINAFECAWPAFFGDAVYIKSKITCPNEHSLRDFNINCNWADSAGHDLLVRLKDGLTTGLGWSGSGDDGEAYETVLDVRPKKANFRGTITAPRGRFTATNDLSGTERNDVAVRIGDEEGQHIDMDTNEIQAKTDPTTPGPLYLNLDGGSVYANGFRIPEIQRGTVTITPTAANTPTSLELAFEKEFSGTPTVIVTPYTSVPGSTVTGVGVNGASTTGCTIWVTRNNTTDTKVSWIAIY